MAAAEMNKAQLHPLVLMSITDSLARHVARSHTTPLAGGLLGQQTREGTTIEVTFDALLKYDAAESVWKMDPAFFENRLRQMEEVNKEPAPLELVGFWTLAPTHDSLEKGLSTHLGGLMEEIMQRVETPLVLAFHTDLLADQMGDSKSNDNAVARMPFTIYESILTDELKAMPVDQDASKVPRRPNPESFRIMSWEMQTGEAEMIALEFVKSGAGNASRVRTGNKTSSKTDAAATAASTASTWLSGDVKGKGKATSAAAAKPAQPPAAKRDLYTPEQEEMLSFLTTRANALKTLRARLSVIRDYLEVAVKDPESANPEMMRAIKALLSRLPGIEEAKNDQIAELSKPSDAQRQISAAQTHDEPSGGVGLTDATLVELLGSLGRSIQSTRELGGKFAIVDSAKRESRRREGMMSGGLGGGQYSDMDMMDLT